jgi:type II secretory pathway predicted ATPase ExeA
LHAYLKFYALEQSPFEATARAKTVLGTKALRDALAAIRSGLQEGSARICVSGESGLGKTSLARALPNLLSEEARVAVVLDPWIPWDALRGFIAEQWGVAETGLARSNLISTCRETRLVLVIDQAESATDDFLDHLDVLLSYRSDGDEPVVQSVLFANLTRHNQEAPAPLVWWLDRIQTRQLVFAPLPPEGVGPYIQKHLKRAGWQSESLFSPEAALAIHGYTSGIPAEVSAACERLLRGAAARDLREIDELFVHQLLEGDFETSAYLAGDEFDALALEKESEGAEERPKTDGETSLAKTLEHFAAKNHDEVTDLATGSDDTSPAASLDLEPGAKPNADPWDAFLAALEVYLSTPATDKALHAIRGGGLRRLARGAAALAILAVIAGIAITWLRGDSPPAVTEPITSSADSPAAGGPASTAAPTGDARDEVDSIEMLQ